MCVYNLSEEKTAEEDFYVYKIVRQLNDRFISRVPYELRLPQDGSSHQGQDYFYFLNKEKISLFSNSPGIYVYQDDKTWLLNNECILLCRVPKGTKYKIASTDPLYINSNCYLVEKLIPLEILTLICEV